MSTQCTSTQLEFPQVGRRRLVASFDGGTITSNAGALLLRAVERCTDVCRRAAQCFQDYRGRSENNRRARFYVITVAGRRRLAVQTEDWERIAGVMARLMRLSPDP